MLKKCVLNKNTLCLAISFYLIGGGVALANFEVSPHIGMSFKEGVTYDAEILGINSSVDYKTSGRTWLFGLDALYNFSLTTNQSLGVGLRYQPSRTYDGASETSAPLDDGMEWTRRLAGTIWTHRVAILTNYRWHFNESFFLGPLLGIDVFRSLKAETSEEVSASGINEIKGSGFLGTGQIGIEAGFKITPLFFIKAEVGYRLLHYDDLEICRGDGQCSSISDFAMNQADRGVNGETGDTSNLTEDMEQATRSLLGNVNFRLDMSGLYALLGIGLSF